jgi:ATP-dependent DNA helicase DinG
MQKTLPLVDFLKTFPEGSNPRPAQTEALEKISEHFSNGKKFVIACLPTGSGKSFIGASVARSASTIDEHRKNLINSYSIYDKDRDGNYKHEEDFLSGESFGSFILTVTKSLQDQYKELFPNTIIAKGKSNYACDIDPNVSVDFAPCLYQHKLKESCFAQNRCPYYKTRNEALMSLDPILNYRSFISLPRFLKKREVYICDEASDLESELVGHYSTTISYAQLVSENIDFNKLYTDDSNEAGKWVQGIYIKLKKELESLKDRLSTFSKTKQAEAINVREKQRLSKLTTTVTSLEDVIEFWDECEYLVEERTSEKVTFVPYDIRPLARRLFNGADRILMMSATITNPSEFTKSLGISEEEYGYVEVGSSFDPKKSPIMCSRKYSLSHNTLEKNLPSILDMAIEICKIHKGEKGIIHTHTNKITEALKKKVGKNSRFLFRQVGHNNEKIILDHKYRQDEDTILVSPSLDTGISLDDDLGRFQIIIKAPFLPLNSKRIKKIFDKNKKYYTMKMLDNLIQMCGRCTRSINDHSKTYILDANAVNTLMDNKKHLPKYFLERFL